MSDRDSMAREEGASEEATISLVARALQRDTAAADALVRRYIRAVYTIAISIVSDPDDAEDVTQEVFARCFERLSDCRDHARFSAWLFQIARTRALNFRRGRRLRRVESLDDPAVREPATRESVTTEVLRRDLRGRLLRALGSLKEVARQVVLLHDLEGWRHGEIASALGISEVASRQHLFKARQALRERLQEEHPNEPVHD